MQSVLSSNDEFIKKLNNIIEANINNPQFGVSVLAKEMGMSRSNLHRKIRLVSKLSTSKYIRKIRLENAMELLRTTNLSGSEVSYMVGFGSVSYFNKCFHDHFGFPPGKITDKNGKTDRENLVAENDKTGLIKVATAALLIVILQAVIFFLVFKPFSIVAEKHVKTIAILPFQAMNEENAPVIEGLRGDLIEKMEVFSNINVIAYHDPNLFNALNIKNKSKKTKIDYLLQGHIQKTNGNFKVRFQLIEASTGKYILSEPYQKEISEEEIFHFQEEVALNVANSINAAVSPKEINLIAENETNNLKAHELYHQGMGYLDIFKMKIETDGRNLNSPLTYLENSKLCFEEALLHDSVYSRIYTGLGWYYFHKSRQDPISEKNRINFLDSALIMAESSLKYQPKLYDALELKSFIHACKGEAAESKRATDQLILLSNNSWEANYQAGKNYNLLNNYSIAIRYFLIAHGQTNDFISGIKVLNDLFDCLANGGLTSEAHAVSLQILEFEEDSIEHFKRISHLARINGKPEEALAYMRKAFRIDSITPETSLKMSILNAMLRNREEMLKYFNYQIEHDPPNLKPEDLIYYGYLYHAIGDQKKADTFLSSVIDRYEDRLESGRIPAFDFTSEMRLACIYSLQGNQSKALESLSRYKEKSNCPSWVISELMLNPMLEPIRNNVEFKEIFRVVKKRFDLEQQKSKNFIIKEGLFTRYNI